MVYIEICTTNTWTPMLVPYISKVTSYTYSLTKKKYFVKVYSHVSIFKNTFKSFTEEKIVFIALKQFN